MLANKAIFLMGKFVVNVDQLKMVFAPVKSIVNVIKYHVGLDIIWLEGID